VVGAGKASVAMAAGLDVACPDVDLSGAIVTRYGHAVPAGPIAVLEAAHPTPDANSERAARTMLDLVSGLTADDLGGDALIRGFDHCEPPRRLIFR
jgi:glycerate 2-kinase